MFVKKIKVKKHFGQKNFCQKMLDPKNICVKQNFLSKRRIWSKKIKVPKMLVQKVWSKLSQCQLRFS